MENTLENKLKFFALYWGLEFTGSDHYGDYMPGTWSEYPKYVDKQYLILKPLSSISDDLKSELEIDGCCSLDYYGVNYAAGEDYWTPIQVDILRSRGYAFPYLGLSVEKLIEYGWVKIKI